MTHTHGGTQPGRSHDCGEDPSESVSIIGLLSPPQQENHNSTTSVWPNRSAWSCWPPPPTRRSFSATAKPKHSFKRRSISQLIDTHSDKKKQQKKCYEHAWLSERRSLYYFITSGGLTPVSRCSQFAAGPGPVRAHLRYLHEEMMWPGAQPGRSITAIRAKVESGK